MLILNKSKRTISDILPGKTWDSDNYVDSDKKLNDEERIEKGNEKAELLMRMYSGELQSIQDGKSIQKEKEKVSELIEQNNELIKEKEELNKINLKLLSEIDSLKKIIEADSKECDRAKEDEPDKEDDKKKEEEKNKNKTNKSTKNR